jgi:hypothetical protein
VVEVLIDDFLPKYQSVEKHQTIVCATPDATYRAIRSADLARGIPVKVLLAIRSLPGALGGGWRGVSELRRRRSRSVTFADFERTGFTVLAENPPCEMLIGLVGSFWKLRGDIRPTNAAHFRGPQEKGTARAAWNFTVEDVGGGRVRLATETRIEPADPASARAFRAYWLIVRPGSGLIRRYMLRSIRREAERTG